MSEVQENGGLNIFIIIKYYLNLYVLGGLYLKDIQTVSILRTTIGACTANRGLGVSIFNTITIYQFYKL